MTESALLALAGGVLGVVLAQSGVDALCRDPSESLREQSGSSSAGGWPCFCLRCLRQRPPRFCSAWLPPSAALAWILDVCCRRIGHWPAHLRPIAVFELFPSPARWRCSIPLLLARSRS